MTDPLGPPRFLLLLLFLFLTTINFFFFKGFIILPIDRNRVDRLTDHFLTTRRTRLSVRDYQTPRAIAPRSRNHTAAFQTIWGVGDAQVVLKMPLNESSVSDPTASIFELFDVLLSCRVLGRTRSSSGCLHSKTLHLQNHGW